MYIFSAGKHTFLPPFLNLKDIVQIESGYENVLLLTSDGLVYGQGPNEDGELGTNQFSKEERWKRIPNIPKINQIALKNRHSLFLTQNGEVYSCGFNYFGQLV